MAAPGRGDKGGKPETQNETMIKREAELKKQNNSITKKGGKQERQNDKMSRRVNVGLMRR